MSCVIRVLVRVYLWRILCSELSCLSGWIFFLIIFCIMFILFGFSWVVLRSVLELLLS